MKITKIILLLAVVFAAMSCEKLGNSDKNKEYKVSITLETQVYSLDYYNSLGLAVYNWKTSSTPSYEVYANSGDNIEVDYPGTLKVSDDGSGNISVVFNENGNTCNVKNLKVSCAVGGSGKTAYIKNNCGRTRLIASVSSNL